MCRPAKCSSCKKTTWSGCGQHVDQVMRSVPASDRCTCRQDGPSKASAASTPPTSKPGAKPSLVSRLFGR